MTSILAKELFLDQRIQKIKEYARKLREGDIEDEGDLFNFFKLKICQAYNMPFFDDYFQKLTLDDMILEVELLIKNQDTVSSLSETLTEASKTEDLFADMEPENDVFKQITDDFFQTGNFVE